MNLWKIRLMGLGMYLVCQQLAHSQSQVSFRQLAVKDGLSQNSAISIAQDTMGYLWIATQDGLNKYDGRSFVVFPFNFTDITKSEYSRLGKIYIDRQGRQWIVPSDGIPRQWKQIGQHFEPVSGVENASTVYQDTELNIWIGTYGQGLFALPKGADRVVKVNIPERLQKAIYGITESADGSGTLFLTTDGGILQFDPITGNATEVTTRTSHGQPIRINFSEILFDATGRQWTATFGDGLYYQNKGEPDFHRISDLSITDPLPLDLNILDLHLDKKNRLWVATYGRGLYMIHLDRMSISHFAAEKHNPRALHYNDVLCIYEDNSGTLWFGTDGAGISYYDEYLEKFNSLTNYQTPDNISIDVVRAIVQDQNKSLWIGTSGKGLTQYEPASNSWRTFRSDRGNKNSISSNRIMSLFADGENEIWIGTQEAGLDLLDSNGQFIHYNANSKVPLSAKNVWTIYNDSRNRKWLGTREQGLIQFDKKKGEIRKYVKGPGKNGGLPSNNIRVITEDRQGGLWIGTEADGVVHFDIESEVFSPLKHRDVINSLSNANIKSLYHDPNGILWIGTNGGGLNAFDIANGIFYAYTAKEGLANDVIYGILPDEEGSLWLSSNKGITKFTPREDLDGTPMIINYNNYDGLATEFNTGAHFKDREGNLYFGGLEGFYWFKPQEIQENAFLPRTAITGFEVSNELWPMIGDQRLNHEQNTLTFTFSSLQYSLPGKNQYQYKLNNYDDDWIWTGNNNFARYSFLPPGDYNFQVKSSNYDGVWNERPASYSFTIAQPWYWTPMAKWVYIALILALAYSVYSYLKWRWKVKVDLQYNEKETHRLQNLNAFKSKLYTDISHEFRTPLTLIAGPVDAKLGEGQISDADYANFSMIKRNTNRLISLVDQLLHLAKLEKGKLKLKIVQGDLGLFLGLLASSFTYRAELKKMAFTTQIEGLKEVWYDGDAIEKIVTNLLDNALKYGREGGVCDFSAARNRDQLEIIVSNTLEENSIIEVEKLFGRFYQQDEFSEGAGIGLSLVQELVHLHSGQVSASLEKGNLIHFRVVLPIAREGFNDNANAEFTEGDHGPVAEMVADSIEMHGAPTSMNKGKEDLPLVLIVEDHSEVREFLKTVWKHKYRIFEAANGKMGIKRALEIVPDIIVTDVRMPICDGIELCNTLKTDERTCHIPIILLTAGIGEEEELKGLQSGADDFVAKPFKLPLLEKRVDNLIETRRALRGRYSQEVVIKAKDIAITPTDEIFLNRLQEVLDGHLSDSEFDTQAFCREIGMSRMQLHRKLLAFTGLSTTAFIRSQRLKQAVQILQTSKATINEVAYTVGFNTPSYFIKCFKEVYKTTPSEYLQSQVK